MSTDETQATIDAIVAQTEQPLNLIQAPEWMREMASLARAASADYVTVPQAIRGKPGSIMTIMLVGRELGLPPMRSLQLIDVINGAPTLRTELKVSFYRRSGHKVEVLSRVSGHSIRLRGVRADSGESLEIGWTLGEPVDDEVAVPNSLRRKDNWTNYPDQMLWARAASQLIRELAPDVVGASLYSTEEMDDPRLPDAD